MSRQRYPKGHPKAGQFMPKTETDAAPSSSTARENQIAMRVKLDSLGIKYPMSASAEDLCKLIPKA